MIKSFQNKEAEKIYKREYSSKLPHDIQKAAMKKMWILDAAPDLHTLKVPPGNRLELLHGDRDGQYSIRINNQWRICFNWHDNNAYNVEIVDYH